MTKVSIVVDDVVEVVVVEAVVVVVVAVVVLGVAVLYPSRVLTPMIKLPDLGKTGA